MQPQRRPFANRRQLCGLKMSEAQSRQIAVLVSEFREALDYAGQLWKQYVEALAKHQEILQEETISIN